MAVIVPVEQKPGFANASERERPLRLLMLGTGTFAVPTFRALLDSEHDVAGLVTQPDRAGRGHHRHVNPMKQVALSAGADIFQPDRANAPDSLSRLREFRAELFVVAAYGQILSPELLAIPDRGAINLHASLLPKYRGAAPVHYAILNGETRTGVSIFQIEPQLDAGPILGVVETDIGSRETAGELESRLAELAVPLTLKVIKDIEQGTVSGRPQDGAEATRAPRMTKAMGSIDWTADARRIDCHVRAMQPWPMPFTFLHQQGRDPLRVLIHEVRIADEIATPEDAAAGAPFTDDGERLFVATGERPVEVVRLQPAGKRVMRAADFLRGHPISAGDRFAPES